MNIYSNSVNLTAQILVLESIDFDTFVDQFAEYLEAHPELLECPVLLHKSDKFELSLFEMSMLIDSLKDLGVLISGIICADESIREFSETIGIRSFVDLESLTINANQSNRQPSPKTSFNEATNTATTNQVAQQPFSQQSSQQETPPLIHLSPIDAVDDSDTSTSANPPNNSVNQPQARQQQPIQQQARQQATTDGFADSKTTQTTQPIEVETQLVRAEPLVIKQSTVPKQVVEYNGDVVIWGDLVATSCVVSTGSVYCYGRAEGSIFAGSEGDKSISIYVADLQCEVISIAGFYAKFDQYKLVRRDIVLMISLQNDNLNFTGMEGMPPIPSAIGNQPIVPEVENKLHYQSNKQAVQFDDVANRPANSTNTRNTRDQENQNSVANFFPSPSPSHPIPTPAQSNSAQPTPSPSSQRQSLSQPSNSANSLNQGQSPSSPLNVSAPAGFANEFTNGFADQSPSPVQQINQAAQFTASPGQSFSQFTQEDISSLTMPSADTQTSSDVSPQRGGGKSGNSEDHAIASASSQQPQVTQIPVSPSQAQQPTVPQEGQNTHKLWGSPNSITPPLQKM